MIRLIAGADRGAHPALVDAMFRGRAGSETEAQPGSMDSYDGEAPLYVIAVDPSSGAVSGSLRLLPTTGRTLLKERFADRFGEPVDFASATIWEGTRFCLHPPDASPPDLDRTACELFLGTCEVGLLAGLTQIVSLFDDRLVRLHRRIGWNPELVGSSPRRTGPGHLHVGLWDVTQDALARMRERSGIHHSVLADAVPAQPMT